MAFNIETFHSEVNKRQGVMPSNRFEIILSNPPAVLSGRTGSGDVSKSMSFWCQEAQFPGYQLLSHNVRRYTYGTNETRPFAPNFQPLQLTFIADNNGDMWDFFNAWTQHILPHDVKTMNSPSGSYGSPSQTNYPYELSYKDEYTVLLNLNVYAPRVMRATNAPPGIGTPSGYEEAKPLFQLEFREAFPSNLNAIQMAWGNQNEYAAFTVFMEYLDWKVVKQENIGGARKFVK
jgi:hypothetical protein